jgi:hypothetical protein
MLKVLDDNSANNFRTSDVILIEPMVFERDSTSFVIFEIVAVTRDSCCSQSILSNDLKYDV